MAGDSQSCQNPINDEAAQWVVALSESAPSQPARRAFEAWRAQGPEYFLAYEFALRAWHRAEMLSALRPAAAAADADLLVRYTLQSKTPYRWVIAGVGVLLAACLAAIVVTWFGYHPAFYETALGHRSVIAFADDSEQ